MNASRRFGLVLSAILIVLFLAPRAMAQVSLTTIGTPIPTQTFNSLPSAGAATWTNNTTITGWYSARTGTGTTIVANDGGSNAGNLYSYGVTADPDRALGSVGSGNAAIGNLFWGVELVNNTGATITSLDVTYTGEQWRNSAAAAQTITFSYLVGSPTVSGTLAEFQAAGVAVPAGDFTSPITGGAAGLLVGNNAPNRTLKTFSITGLSIPTGTEIMLRWSDPDHTGADHGLSIDDFTVTPQGAVANAAIVPTCPSPVTTTAGTATTQGVSATDSDGTVTSATITSITPSDPGTITLTGFTPAGAVGGTANATLDVGAATPANTYSVTIQWANNDGTPQTANCVVSVVVNPAPTPVFIHQIQTSGAATGMPGATVTIEGVVIGDFQPIPNDNRLSGFFVQEEDTDADGNLLTSEGIFVFCSACPTNVAEGQRVQVTGTVSEFFNSTQITATTAGAVVITDAGNNLGDVTPATINLPIVTPTIDDFYEPMESMLVNYVDTLTVSEYFEQARYGRIELFEGGRPRQYTEANPPSAAGYAAHLDNLSRRRVYLDDDDNVENSVLNLPDGSQFVFHPQANGGLSAIGTQGTDFFRGGDQIADLTGILHYSFSGGSTPNEWRIRPASATPAAFTVVNPRPATPPAVGGAIRAASVNVLNYFTTLNQRGADSAAELNRQRERISRVLCGLDADVAALMEIENHPTHVTINDLLADVNTRCGGTTPYAFVNTGGALGTDQIRVLLIYRTNVLSPVGAAQVDLDPVHNRPPTAQTFDVVDNTNPAFGQRFTAVANHGKSKGCGGASGADLDQNDGQGCFAATRVAQANRILTWVNGTVIPAAGGDPDVLLLGDFNSYAQETATTTITSGGYTDLESAFLGPNAYSYLFDGQLGHLDYIFSSTSLTPQVTGVQAWHINADENPLFDYNDEIDDGAFEQAFEEKPDGSALAPPRILFEPGTVFRASDHDPVLAGIFSISDLVITKTDSPDPVNAGSNLTYTITVTNNGPDTATSAAWSDTITGTTFVSLSSVAGWSCTTPSVGAAGAINCTNPTFGVGNAVFTLVVAVPVTTADGTILSNTANVTSGSTEGNPGDEGDTETTTVATSADLSVTKSDSPDPVNAGNDITYTITLNNAGPSDASTVQLTDAVPANTTFVSLVSPGGWSCTTPAVGGTGNVTCNIGSLGLGDAVFTLVVNVDPSTASGASISNSATVTSSTSDPNSGNETGNAATTVATSADLSVTKSDSPDPVNAGSNITYTITLNNAGPSNASTVELTDAVPANTTFVSLASPGGWSCTTPAVGGTGNVSCTNASVGLGNAVFTLVVNVNPATASGATISNSATVTSTTSDPNSGNETGNAATAVTTSADLSVTKTDSPDPVNAGNNITYTITVTNAGPSNASTVTLDETLPAETTFVSLSSPAGWSCTTPPPGFGGTISCSAATVDVGSDVFTLVLNVTPGTASGTVITNSITVASATTDPNPGDETGNATTTVNTSADLSVTKTDSPDPVVAGNNLTYTIILNNAGPSNAAAVTLSDTLPAGTTFVSLTAPPAYSCTTPAVGATGTISCSNADQTVGLGFTFTLVVNVDPSLAGGTVLSNTVTVASTTTDPNTGDESDTETTTVDASADLAVTKVDTPDPVTAGTNLTYTITINNSGPSTATTLTLSDTIPAGTTFVSLSAPAGWSCTTPAVGGTGNINCSAASQLPGNAVFTLVVNVDAGLADGTVITNTATAASPIDFNATNNSGVATTTVGTGSADLSITKSDSPDPVTPGTNLTYTITVTNAGPSNATSATMTDNLPLELTFVSIATPAGWTCTTPAVGGFGTVSCSNLSMAVGSAVFTIVTQLRPNPFIGPFISNTATTGSATTDPNSANNSATEQTAPAPSSSDLYATKIDAPDPVTPGANISYTITLGNNGPSTASFAQLDDFMPAGTSFVSVTPLTGVWFCSPAQFVPGITQFQCTTLDLEPGQSITLGLVLAVDPSVAPGTVLTNTATAGGANDPNASNNNGVATTLVGPAFADLSLTKIDTPDPVAPGANITYTITLNNAGPSNAATVVLADTVPANTTFVSMTAPAGWSCTTPAVGGTGAISCSNASVDLGNDVFTLVVNVDAAVTAGTVITNTATSTSASADQTPGNENATATTTVGSGTADMSVTKSGTPDPVAAGANITYTITVDNAGPNAATTASLTDTIPANTTFVSLSSPAAWACATPAVGGTGTITCTNASMAVGNAVFTLVVNVNAGTAGGTVISNTATADSATTDPAAGNDSATDTTTVLTPATPPSVSGTKTASGTFAAGSTVTYTIVLTNSGGTAQGDNPGNEFIDVLPSQLTLISANATSGTAVATVATNTVTWNGSIAAGGTVTITIQALIELDVPVGTSVSNQGTINFDGDGNGTNESSTVTDDPGQGGGSNPTPFVVGAPTGIDEVPALDGFGLAVLAALLAALGLFVVKRS